MKYPNLTALEQMYPHVKVAFVQSDDNHVHGREVVNGKQLEIVDFCGLSENSVKEQIFRTWHWESTGKQLPPPFSSSYVPTIPATNPVSLDSSDEEESKHAGTGLVWIVNNQQVDRRKINPSELEEYKAKGYTEGKKFADWVDPKQIAIASEKAKQRNIERIQELQRANGVQVGAGRGTHFIGLSWVQDISTKVKMRKPKQEAEKLIASGTHKKCGPRS